MQESSLERLQEEASSGTDSFKWSNLSLARRANQLGSDHVLAKRLGLARQAKLIEDEFRGLLLLDVLMGLGISPWELVLVPHGSEEGRPGLYKLVLANEGKTLDVWMKCPLDSSNFRLPSEALEILAKIDQLPHGVFGEVYVLQKMASAKGFKVTDHRGVPRSSRGSLLLNPYSKSREDRQLLLPSNPSSLMKTGQHSQSDDALAESVSEPLFLTRKPDTVDGSILAIRSAKQHYGLLMWV